MPFIECSDNTVYNIKILKTKMLQGFQTIFDFGKWEIDTDPK